MGWSVHYTLIKEQLNHRLFTLLVQMFFYWGGPPASSLTLIVTHHIASHSVTCMRMVVTPSVWLAWVMWMYGFFFWLSYRGCRGTHVSWNDDEVLWKFHVEAHSALEVCFISHFDFILLYFSFVEAHTCCRDARIHANVAFTFLRSGLGRSQRYFTLIAFINSWSVSRGCQCGQKWWSCFGCM